MPVASPLRMSRSAATIAVSSACDAVARSTLTSASQSKLAVCSGRGGGVGGEGGDSLALVAATSPGVAAPASRARGDGRRAGGGGGGRSGLLLLLAGGGVAALLLLPAAVVAAVAAACLRTFLLREAASAAGAGDGAAATSAASASAACSRLLLVLDAGLVGGAAELFGEFGDDGGASHFIFFLRVAEGCTERAWRRERWVSM